MVSTSGMAGVTDLGRHPLADFGTATALLGALLHHVIVAGQPLTILGTGAAHLSAYAACVLVEIGASKHEIDAGLADFRAVEKQPDVRRVGVPTAELETMTDHLKTDCVTSSALIDALLHLGRGMGCSMMCHGRILSLGLC
jgi:hypothetical protein